MKNITLAKLLGPCDLGCDCVPPQASYDYTTHSTVACCKWDKSCDGTRMPTGDKVGGLFAAVVRA